PGRESVNTIVAIDLEGGGVKVIAAGNDFYSSPRLSPDGNTLAWMAWDHPNMPWDGSELWSAAVNEDGSLGQAEMIAGGKSESIFQPEWSPDGVLYFASDRSGWWNLYRRRETGGESICDSTAEFGAPQWVFRMSTYAFESAQRIVCTYNDLGA